MAEGEEEEVEIERWKRKRRTKTEARGRRRRKKGFSLLYLSSFFTSSLASTHQHSIKTL